MGDRYWVPGGSEVFSDTDNWSLVSGGASGASVPGAGDTAHFDANSGEAGYCEITSAVLCHIDTTGIPAGFSVSVYGGGSLSLQEDLIGLSDLVITETGTLTTNNFNITATSNIQFRETAVVNLGTSTLTIGNGGEYVSGFFAEDGVTLDADEATIIFYAWSDDPFSWASFDNYGHTLGTVQIIIVEGSLETQLDIGYNSVIDILSITGDGVVMVYSDGGVQTIITSLTLEGDTPGGLSFYGYEDSIWTISKASGTVTAVNCTLENSHATGGAKFNALPEDGNVDGGGNTGWDFGEGEIPDISEEASVADSFDSLIDEVAEEISAIDLFENLIEAISEEISATALIAASNQTSPGISEEATVADDIGAILSISITDELNLADSQGTGWLKELIDTIFTYDELQHGWAVTAESSLILTDAIETLLGIIVDEWITFIDIQSNNWNGREIITEDVTLYDIAGFAKIYADSLTDEINIADVSTYQLTITVLEYLGFTELATALRTAAEAVSDSIDIADSSALAFPQSVESVLNVVDLSAVAVQFLHSVQSDFNLADVSSLIKRFSDTLSDPIVFVDTITSRATLYSLIYDTLRLNVLVDLEGEFYECYVLNTPKFHPSMYSGFDFNSFCVFENRAFGANDTGIYELTGDTDAGNTIHTGIIFSNTNFDLPNQKRFRRGYLDISGTSPKMILETEGGQRQAYAIDEQGKMVASHELKSKSWILSVADFETLSSMKLIPVILTK